MHPAEYDASLRELAAIEAKIRADERAFLLAAEPLGERDLAIIGRVIQNYCYADLSARRIIDTIRHAALGPEHMNAGKLQDTQVFPKLREAIKDLPEEYRGEGIARAADIIELHRANRHLFAHWAARRVPGHHAFVLYTKNEREALSGTTEKLGHGVAKYALVALVPLLHELKKLEEHGSWLAAQSARLEAALPQLTALFEERKRAERAEKYEAGKFKKGNPGPRN